MTEHGEGPNALGRWRHLTLLISILLLFIASPFVAPLQHGPTILSIVATIVLLSATYAVSTRKHLVGIAPILSLATIMTNFLLVAVPSYWILVVSHSTIVVLIAFFAITILVYVVRSGRITADKTYAAICSLSADRIRLDLCLRPS